MCGADNSGSCQIACNSGQRSIPDTTNRCTGALNGSGGTLCCSPASVQEYPASQCSAMGGFNGYNETDCALRGSGWYAAGKYLKADCSEAGFCCVPENTSYQPAQACTAENCEGSVPGAQCRIACQSGETPSSAGKCTEPGKTCCIPGGGGICQDKGGVCVTGACSSENREANPNGGACVGVDSGKSCCSLNTIGTESSLSLQNYTLLEEIPGQPGASGNLAKYLESLYKFTFWAIGIAALFMLTVGGFMYVTSAGNTARIGTAKTIIVDALLGLIIALFAWLFLYVLNPDLVEGLKLPGLSQVNVSSGTGAGAGTTRNFTQDECYAAKGAFAAAESGCKDINPDYFKIGNFLNTQGQVNGVCCAAKEPAAGTGNCPNPPNTSVGCCPQSATIICQACSDCLAIPSSVPNKGCGLSTCYLNRSLLSKIQAISGVSGWRITESWPPTVFHESNCHTRGTCADINNSGGGTDVDTIKRYYDAFRAAGLSVLYENARDCAPYTAKGINCKSYPQQTNLSSFHVQ